MSQPVQWFVGASLPQETRALTSLTLRCAWLACLWSLSADHSPPLRACAAGAWRESNGVSMVVDTSWRLWAEKLVRGHFLLIPENKLLGQVVLVLPTMEKRGRVSKRA